MSLCSVSPLAPASSSRMLLCHLVRTLTLEECFLSGSTGYFEACYLSMRRGPRGTADVNVRFDDDVAYSRLSLSNSSEGDSALDRWKSLSSATSLFLSLSFTPPPRSSFCLLAHVNCPCLSSFSIDLAFIDPLNPIEMPKV